MTRASAPRWRGDSTRADRATRLTRPLRPRFPSSFTATLSPRLSRRPIQGHRPGSSIQTRSQPKCIAPVWQGSLQGSRPSVYGHTMRTLNVLLVVVAIVALAAVALLLFDRDKPVEALGWLALLLGLFLTLGPSFVRRNDRLVLAWTRLRYRLRGSPSLPWNLSVELRGDFSDAQLFDHVEAGLTEILRDRLRLIQPRPVNGLRLAVDGLGFVELVLDDVNELDATAMRIDFTGLRVAPHEAERVLLREILPSIQKIEQAVPGMLREQSWSLRVKIDPSTNPFLGLYLRDRKPEEVLTFRASLPSPAFPADRVDIDKESLYLSASTSDGFTVLVRDFLTFSDRAVAAPSARA
jgi:hypothetical protein